MTRVTCPLPTPERKYAARQRRCPRSLDQRLLLLLRGGWSWADAQGNFDLRAPGLVTRQRRAVTAPAPKQRSLPRGSGSYAVIRALVRFSSGEDEEPSATALAAQAGISQPRVSQVLHQLRSLELIDMSGHGRWAPRREALLDRFLAEYPGPGGSEHYYYTLDSPVEAAGRLREWVLERP